MRYGNRSGTWLPVGVGIDVGNAFVGNVGPENYVDLTALGDPVNTAARIQAAAAPGELLVSEAAYQAVRADYPDAERRSLDVKGKSGEIAVRSVPLS